MKTMVGHILFKRTMVAQCFIFFSEIDFRANCFFCLPVETENSFLNFDPAWNHNSDHTCKLRQRNAQMWNFPPRWRKGWWEGNASWSGGGFFFFRFSCCCYLLVIDISPTANLFKCKCRIWGRGRVVGDTAAHTISVLNYIGLNNLIFLQWLLKKSLQMVTPADCK